MESCRLCLSSVSALARMFTSDMDTLMKERVPVWSLAVVVPGTVQEAVEPSGSQASLEEVSQRGQA